jgi:hypothetical protein
MLLLPYQVPHSLSRYLYGWVVGGDTRRGGGDTGRVGGILGGGGEVLATEVCVA